MWKTSMLRTKNFNLDIRGEMNKLIMKKKIIEVMNFSKIKKKNNVKTVKLLSQLDTFDDDIKISEIIINKQKKHS